MLPRSVYASPKPDARPLGKKPRGRRSVKSNAKPAQTAYSPVYGALAGKDRANRLAFAVLLHFFRANGRFLEMAENPYLCCGPGGATTWHRHRTDS